MKYIGYNDLSTFLTDYQIRELTTRFPGYAVPGKKAVRSAAREAFIMDRFDGNVKNAAIRFGVTPRTIYSWLIERQLKQKGITR